ncbi:DUF397 domain-containing protein [Actinomadura chibensis]|uniref:DUF397 domain-containing protein n=1 Tax=Actinomadura chibensis TaxID=392828 RepID=A0A5D0NU88_9ACTN|nr:DUF397 domain-containing protein [Actinomadura chibensis]TYB48066.1 DUF397 domain-containing protein [Actinomadura chibensis]
MDLTNAIWRKASHSHDDGDQCIELTSTDASWRKASRSTVQNDSCVEVAGVSNVVAIRDSKDRNGPKLIISNSDFRNFADVLKNI